MADFLDQDAIDRLQYELAVIGSKKQLASDAKDKIRSMYFDIVKTPLVSALDSLEEIYKVISKIDAYIKQDSPYTGSFFKLKASYYKRIT
jgi:hypothetical protein